MLSELGRCTYLMKRKKICRVILIICFIFAFPFLLSIMIRISTFFLNALDISPYIYIAKAYEIDFSDYLIIIISLTSCICTGVIGYTTYKLSLTDYKGENTRNNYYKLYVIGKLIYDIKQNAEIIAQKENKIQDRHKEIDLSSTKLIYVLYSPLSQEQLNKLHEIYTMFSKYKENGSLSSREKKRWILENGNVDIEKIINELKEGEKKLYAELN